jgi:hypothetical protein
MSLGSHGSDIRLVITGHDNDGKGGIAADCRVGSGGPAADAWQAYLLWGTDKLPKFPDAGQPGSFTTPTPPPGAVRFCELVVYPEGQRHEVSAPTDLARDGVHKAEGEAGGMHYTATIDFVVVIDGEVVLRLDKEETVLRKGDYLVQNGTRHEWINRGKAPARLGVFVVGTEHAGF